MGDTPRGKPRQALGWSERKVMDSLLGAMKVDRGPIDLPLAVVAWWLKPKVGSVSKREALEVVRSLIRKGYIKGELGWDAVYGVILAADYVDSDDPAAIDGIIMDKKNIFVVHGHDAHLKEAVARFIERLGFNAIILAERPSGGRTIIEQVERYSDVEYAVVLLTPDDVVGDEDATSRPAQARQNVIFELGFFVGRLGRSRVHCLRKGEPRRFSDFDGVIWTPVDDPGIDWRIKLAQEMSDAGFDVDLNKVFPT